MVVILVGCSHQKTQRGHLFRADWAFEYNRTPWIGCPPDAGYSEVNEKGSGIHGLFSCLSKDKDGDAKNRKKFRYHCAQNAECSAQNPCCRTLGCGMWIDPDDPATFATLGGAATACGLLPFCTPQKPCCLTPNCGKPAAVNINPQTLMLANQNAGIPGRNVTQGTVPGNAAAVQNGIGTIRGMSPTGMMPGGMGPTGMLSSGVGPTGMMSGRVVGAVPGGTLVSRGIVPGASAITSGGMVAAIGVATPAGVMTPTGIRLPNGMVSNALVLRACLLTPNCTAAHPCGLTPNCGGAVAVNMVADNAAVFASALQAQGVSGGVMQAGGMGMLVNPITNQPVPGLTMGGYPQAGYPPIGYAPSGYAPGYPRFAAGMVDAGEISEEEHREEEVVLPQETRSNMPVPRFHPIPSQPAFQRSEGMPATQRTVPQPTPTAMSSGHELSERELESALDQAYLEGVSAAMDEVERKLEAKRQAVARAKLEEKILLQAEYVQQQLDAREEMRMLAMQRERQLHQQALRQQTIAAAVPEPPRLLPSNGVGAASPRQQASPASVRPVQLAGNLTSSVVSGVNEMFAPLLGANQVNRQVYQRGQAPATVQPRDNTSQQKSQVPIAAVQTDLPVKPPVLSTTPNYGLLDDESELPILQARFSDDGEVVQP